MPEARQSGTAYAAHPEGFGDKDVSVCVNRPNGGYYIASNDSAVRRFIVVFVFVFVGLEVCYVTTEPRDEYIMRSECANKTKAWCYCVKN